MTVTKTRSWLVLPVRVNVKTPRGVPTSGIRSGDARTVYVDNVYFHR
jgi:hypothetical protein